MDYRTIFQISSAGMNLEKQRVDIAALNLANMHSSAAPGQTPYLSQRVVAEPLNVNFETVMNGVAPSSSALRHQVAISQVQTPPRLMHDPGHPHADVDGFVHFAGVDHATEMLTVLTAVRAYEANIAVASSARAMAAKALEIGG